MSASPADCETTSKIINAALFPKPAASYKNRELLSLTEGAGFELLVTMDKGLQYQQNPASRKNAILIVRAKSNRLADLLPHVDACRSAVRTIAPGEVGWDL